MLSMDSSTESAANWLDNATTINGDPMGSFVNLEMLNLNPNNMTDMEEARYLLGLPDQREALSTAIPLTIIYALLLVTGCLGNLCTAIVIARPKNRYMHTATNYYLFSLAMSDFLFLITGLPDEIYALWQRYPYRFSETFCILRGYISEASTDASILTITAFTVERYVAICHPLWAHKLSQLPRVITNIIVIWMAAAIFAIPPAAQLGLIYFNSPIDQRILYVTSQCGAKKNIFDYMFITSAIFFFIIPMIIVTVLYILIAIELRKSSKMNSISSATMRSNGTSSMVHSVSVSAVNSSIVYGNQQDTESCQCHHRFPQTQTQAQAQAQQASSTLINRTPGLKQLSHHFSFSSTTKPPAALNTAAPAANSATCLNHHRYLSKSVHGSKWSDDRRKQAIRDNNVSCICSCHHCHCSVCVGATRENSSGCQDNGYDSMCHEDDSEYSVGRKCPKQLCTDAANTTSNNNKNNLRYNFNYPVKLTKDLTRSCMLGNIVTIRWNNRYIPKRNKTQECNNNIINHDNNNSKQHNRQACANNHRAVNHEACDVMHRGIIHNKHSFQNRHRFSRDNTRGCTNDTLNSSSKVSSVKQQQPTIDIFVQSPSSPSAAKCIASSVDDRNDYSQSNEECHKADERTLLEQTMQSERQKQRQRDNSELGHCDNGTILNEQMRQNSVSNSASINGSSESNAKNDDNNNANRGASSSMMMMTIPLKGADDGEQLGYDKDSAMPLVSSASEPNFEAVPSIKDHGTPKIAAEAPSIQMDALAAPISSRPQHHCCGHKHGSNSNIKLANHSCKRHPTAVNCCSNCNCVSCSNCGCCFAASKAGENIHPPQRHSRQSAVVTANCDTKLTMTRPPSACSAVASLISVSDRTSSHYEAGSAPPTPATSECYCQRTVPNQLVTRRSNAASSRKSVIRMLVAVVVSFFICWSPFHAQRVLARFITNDNLWLRRLFDHITYVSGIMYYLSSTINPLLYQLMSAKFRLAFKDTFNCSLFGICFAAAAAHRRQHHSSSSGHHHHSHVHNAPISKCHHHQDSLCKCWCHQRCHNHNKETNDITTTVRVDHHPSLATTVTTTNVRSLSHTIQRLLRWRPYNDDVSSTKEASSLVQVPNHLSLTVPVSPVDDRGHHVNRPQVVRGRGSLSTPLLNNNTNATTNNDSSNNNTSEAAHHVTLVTSTTAPNFAQQQKAINNNHKDGDFIHQSMPILDDQQRSSLPELDERRESNMSSVTRVTSASTTPSPPLN